MGGRGTRRLSHTQSQCQAASVVICQLQQIVLSISAEF
jgi:hypothetical protein